MNYDDILAMATQNFRDQFAPESAPVPAAAGFPSGGDNAGAGADTQDEGFSEALELTRQAVADQTEPLGIRHSPSIGEFAVLRVAKLEAQLRAADELLCTLGDYMQDRADVRDGDEGDGPSANAEMSLEREIDWLRENIAQALKP